MDSSLQGPEDVSASEDEGGRKRIGDDEDNEGMGPVEELLEWGIRRGVFGRIESSGEVHTPTISSLSFHSCSDKRFLHPFSESSPVLLLHFVWRPRS